VARVDHDGEVRKCLARKQSDTPSAPKFIKSTMKRHRKTRVIITDRLHSYRAAMDDIGNAIGRR